MLSVPLASYVRAVLHVLNFVDWVVVGAGAPWAALLLTSWFVNPRGVDITEANQWTVFTVVGIVVNVVLLFASRWLVRHVSVLGKQRPRSGVAPALTPPPCHGCMVARLQGADTLALVQQVPPGW